MATTDETHENLSDVELHTETETQVTQPVSKLRSKSRLWDYFSISSPQEKKAKCSICNAMIARGGANVRSFTTTNLRNHLRCLHGTEFRELENKEREQQEKKRKIQQEESASTSSEIKKAYQMKISDAIVKHVPWGPSDPRRKAQNKLLVELVAIDLEPFSIVDRVGFRRYTHGLEPRYTLPDRTQLSRTEIPALYNKVIEKIKQEHIDKETALAFTTDIWSSSHGANSLMSLTCHWIDEKFVKKSCVLNASSLPGSHTGEAIAAEIKRMCSQWDIPEEHTLVIVCDNAANAVRGCELTGLNHLGCFIHTLQLVVKDGMGTQRAINDMLAVTRKIVGHFNHSPLAYHRLHQIQSKHGLPEHSLVQEVATRWNSTFYMLERVIVQKLALVEYCTEYDLPVMTPNQWALAQTLVQNLQRFEYFTREASEAKASASMIIPAVSLLSRALGSHKNDRGIQTMTDAMLTSLNKRYSDIESNKLLVLSTFLDPRYKDHFFLEKGDTCRTETTKDMVMKWINEEDLMLNKIELQSKSPDRSNSSSLLSPREEVDDSTQSSAKRMRRESKKLVDTEFQEMLHEKGLRVKAQSKTVNIEDECAAFQNDQLLDRAGDIYQWWAVNSSRYPRLSKLARKFLAALPSSVASERLFSEAGELYDEKRNKLDPNKAEMILVIRGNIPLLNLD